MAALVSEQRVWRELTNFHFSNTQIDVVLKSKDIESSKEIKDWQKMYHDLRKYVHLIIFFFSELMRILCIFFRTYGVHENFQYTEILSLCRLCRCLFWPSAGHPCIIDQCPDFRARLLEAGGPIESQPVPPAQFLKFFSL